MMSSKTWQEKADWENANCPAHAEGYAVAPGTPIKILDDETGKPKIIPFDPATLKLSTRVLNWRLPVECPICKSCLEHIEDLNTHAGDFNGYTISNLSYNCPNCGGSVNIITEEQNNETMFMRLTYRKNGYKEKLEIR